MKVSEGGGGGKISVVEMFRKSTNDRFLVR